MKSRRLNRFLLWLWGAPFPDWLRWLFLWVKYPRFLATVAAVIVNERGEVLLFHHTYRRSYPWGLPGGWLERSEDPALAIQREVEEESGLHIRVLRPLLAARDPVKARLDLIFLAKLVGGCFRPSDEVDQALFYPLEALPALSVDAKEVIRAAVEEDYYHE